MKPYLLKRQSKIYDDLGTPIDEYIPIKTIDISVNYATSTKIEDGIFYKITVPAGITMYKEFDMTEQYRLDGNGHVFSIEGINQGGRRTILSLKEVYL
ncbi:hypothetical protein HZF24_04510 [Sedimentibacter hydroxybenzoicus DSM 7310]|uniref:Uncharacterized protein n=1 Tax=Sedimentibacter hydroxybenzoicus DSM 7310 TaxID=1123245 RepID=A0A974BHS2_SEDHY|nr:hypothetical protein [Sedimentibacter hydroxybenzoicus]NYB73398.1 hypothetical protein [Sedimentibacter hydroxybenzoicus DSM 7310]